jgi:cytoskeleton protein RodZ
MSEQDQDLPIQFANTGQAALDAGKSAGQLLREAREAQGMHVAALAVSLKVPVKKLEALEADRLHELPDAVFVRALASSVCRALKIEAAPILDKLPQLSKRLASQETSGVNVAFRTRADGPAPSVFANLSKPVLLGVVALLLGAIVLIFLPDFASRMNGASSSAGTNSTNGTGVSMGNTVTVDSVPINASNATTSTISGSAATNETPTLTTLSVTPALSTPSVPSPTLTISAATAPVVAVPEGSIIVFTATGETWVEVREAGGKIALQRLLQAGDKVGTAGRAPLSVTVGRADQAQVTVRGQAFDLAPVSSKDLVARFKVN